MHTFRRYGLVWALTALVVTALWLGFGSDTFGASAPATPAPQCVIAGTPSAGVVDVDAIGCEAAGVGTPVAGGGLTVTLSLSSDRAAPQNIVVEVRDQAGKPVDDAKVTLINRHLEMDHGDFVRELVHDHDGRYLGEKVGMGMGGQWQTEIQVARAGQETVTFIFTERLKGVGE
jgi:hypothetical protein